MTILTKTDRITIYRPVPVKGLISIIFLMNYIPINTFNICLAVLKNMSLLEKGYRLKLNIKFIN